MTKKQATPYPLRMSPELRAELEERAKESGRSLNAEILSIISESLNPEPSEYDFNESLKVVRISPKIQRVIRGKLLAHLDLDFTQSLSEIKRDIETSLEFMKLSKSAEKGLRFAIVQNKPIVYQGSNHLDIIKDGAGSLGWLTVEDHLI